MTSAFKAADLSRRGPLAPSHTQPPQYSRDQPLTGRGIRYSAAPAGQGHCDAAGANVRTSPFPRTRLLATLGERAAAPLCAVCHVRDFATFATRVTGFSVVSRYSLCMGFLVQILSGAVASAQCVAVNNVYVHRAAVASAPEMRNCHIGDENRSGKRPSANAERATSCGDDCQFATSVARSSTTVWQLRLANVTRFSRRVHSSFTFDVSEDQ